MRILSMPPLDLLALSGVSSEHASCLLPFLVLCAGRARRPSLSLPHAHPQHAVPRPPCLARVQSTKPDGTRLPLLIMTVVLR